MKRRFLLAVLTLVTPLLLFAQEAQSTADMGLDERINAAFAPIADWFGSVILHNFPGTGVPTIIFFIGFRSSFLYGLFRFCKYP